VDEESADEPEMNTESTTDEEQEVITNEVEDIEINLEREDEEEEETEDEEIKAYGDVDEESNEPELGEED